MRILIFFVILLLSLGIRAESFSGEFFVLAMYKDGWRIKHEGNVDVKIEEGKINITGYKIEAGNTKGKKVYVLKGTINDKGSIKAEGYDLESEGHDGQELHGDYYSSGAGERGFVSIVLKNEIHVLAISRNW